MPRNYRHPSLYLPILNHVIHTAIMKGNVILTFPNKTECRKFRLSLLPLVKAHLHHETPEAPWANMLHYSQRPAASNPLSDGNHEYCLVVYLPGHDPYDSCGLEAQMRAIDPSYVSDKPWPLYNPPPSTDRLFLPPENSTESPAEATDEPDPAAEALARLGYATDQHKD